MAKQTKSRVLPVRMPESLYNRIVYLAHKSLITPNAWAVKTMGHSARWKWEDTPSENDSVRSGEVVE